MPDRLVPILIALAVLVPHASWAGLDLTWSRCGGSGGDSTTVLDCRNPESVATLIGAFQTPDTVAGFTALGITLDLQFETKDVEPFWHFEVNGCNRSGATFSDAPPASGCDGVVSPWGEEGELSIGAIAGYAAHHEGRNRARLIGIVARSANDPITLAPGQSYFGFQLRFFSENASEAGGKCDGCRAPFVVRWSAGSLSRVPPAPGMPAAEDIVLTGPGLRSDCVSANGASASECAALPPPRRTWDSLRGIQR